jgi:NTE family protein
MDGAIVNNTPISHAVELGADRVIVLQAIGSDRLSRPPRGVLAAGVTAVSRAMTRRFAEDVVRYADATELVVLPAPRLDGIMPTDFGHADELIALGLRRARMLLANGHRVARLPRAA